MQPVMKAYAVLAGGGVKGAALAGCLSAASDLGIEFEGFGGTSAGSIVALLGSIGMTGREIRDLMLTDFHPSKALDDGGTTLTSMKRTVDAIRSHWTFGMFPFKYPTLAKELVCGYRLGRSLFHKNGLYRGKALHDMLHRVLLSRLPSLAGRPAESVTFEDLLSAGSKPLRVVVSNISRRRVKIMPSTDGDPLDPRAYQLTSSVLRSIQASASFPFVYQPQQLAENRTGAYYSDGGLSCNLPIFLFDDEQEETQYPIIAFDLVADLYQTQQEPSLWNFTVDMFNTALEAGLDVLLNKARRNHLRIQVPIPPALGTLSFNLSEEDILELYRRGYHAAYDSLVKFYKYRNALDADGDLQGQVQARYSHPSLVTTALAALVNQVETLTMARGVRAVVMLPTGKNPPTRIVTFNHGMRPGDRDFNLELGYFSGATGLAIQNKGLVLVNMQDPKVNPADWGLTSEQQAAIPNDRKSLACFPILYNSSSEYRPNPEELLNSAKTMGSISVDSSTDIQATRWQQDDTIAKLMRDWADIMSRIFKS